MAKLLLVRHGQTDFNSGFKFVGSTDSDLNATGRRQIEKLGERLVKEELTAIYSSDLARARHSAEILRAGRNIPVNSVPELREMDYGQAEGLTFQEIDQRYPKIAALMKKSDSRVAFPDGEGFKDVEARIQKFTGELKQYSPRQTVLIVTHGGPLRMLTCLLLAASLDIWWKLRIDNASLNIVKTYEEMAILNLLNDTSHLIS